MSYVKRETFKDGRGYVLPEYRGVGSLAFVADVPDHVIVDAVAVGDQFLDDFVPFKPLYPPTLKEGMRVVAIVTGLEDTEFYSLACQHLIEQFDVVYHEEAVVTVR